MLPTAIQRQELNGLGCSRSQAVFSWGTDSPLPHCTNKVTGCQVFFNLFKCILLRHGKMRAALD